MPLRLFIHKPEPLFASLLEFTMKSCRSVLLVPYLSVTTKRNCYEIYFSSFNSFFDTFQFWLKWGQVYGHIHTDFTCISADIASH
jgi:hypothetical protein